MMKYRCVMVIVEAPPALGSIDAAGENRMYGQHVRRGLCLLNAVVEVDIMQENS